MKNAKKTFIFYYMNFAVHVQQPGGQKRYGLVLTVMINPPELPINEKA